MRIGDGPWIPNTLRIPQYTIIPREYHSTRRIPQGTTLCHVDLRVKQHDAQNCFAKNTSKCLPITDHRCLPPQTLFSLQHVWSFPDENPIPNHHSPRTQFVQLFHIQKVLISIWAGGLIWEVFPGNGGWVYESGMNCLLCTWHCVTDMLPSSSLLYLLAHSDLFLCVYNFPFFIFLLS